MVTVEERVSRLEGGYEHLATKADLANLRTDIQSIEIRLLVRLGGLMITGFAVMVTVLRLWN